MDQLLNVMALLIAYPVLATAIGILLIALGRWTRRRTPAAAGALWFLYSLYEIGMQRRWLCSGECNIRVDLLIIYPALVLSLIAALLSLLHRRRKSTSR
jgi:hypothetical protein